MTTDFSTLGLIRETRIPSGLLLECERASFDDHSRCGLTTFGNCLIAEPIYSANESPAQEALRGDGVVDTRLLRQESDAGIRKEIAPNQVFHYLSQELF